MSVGQRKKSESLTGFEPMTSQTLGRCSIHWGMENSWKARPYSPSTIMLEQFFGSSVFYSRQEWESWLCTRRRVHIQVTSISCVEIQMVLLKFAEEGNTNLHFFPPPSFWTKCNDLVMIQICALIKISALLFNSVVVSFFSLIVKFRNNCMLVSFGIFFKGFTWTWKVKKLLKEMSFLKNAWMIQPLEIRCQYWQENSGTSLR